MITRSQIIAEARAWIGTPYRHQARVKRVGCDCAGLAFGVGLALGIFNPGMAKRPEAQRFKGYGREPVGGFVDAMGLFFVPIPLEQVAPGDVVLMSIMGHVRHAGIVGINSAGDRLTLIHSYVTSVIESGIDQRWRARFRHAFQYPGVAPWPSTLPKSGRGCGCSKAVIQEAYIQGISTRPVDDLVQDIGGSGISTSQVSRPCEEIDERIHAFLDRPIEGDWPYLWIAATYVKTRQAGQIVSVPVVVAVGVNADGRREILGMDIGPSGGETFWKDFLRKLARRGLRGVKLVISDSHEGIKAAVSKVLTACWQRCREQFMRDARAVAPISTFSPWRFFLVSISSAFAQNDPQAARQQWRHVADQLRSGAPKLAALMDQAEPDVLAYMSFPAEHRVKLRSTTPLERLNGEIKRRTEVVGIFPNEAAITRVVGAILLEQNDAGGDFWAHLNRARGPAAISGDAARGEA